MESRQDPFELLKLPVDILLEIAKYLDINDLAALCMSSNTSKTVFKKPLDERKRKHIFAEGKQSAKFSNGVLEIWGSTYFDKISSRQLKLKNVIDVSINIERNLFLLGDGQVYYYDNRSNKISETNTKAINQVDQFSQICQTQNGAYLLGKSGDLYAFSPTRVIGDISEIEKIASNVEQIAGCSDSNNMMYVSGGAIFYFIPSFDLTNPPENIENLRKSKLFTVKKTGVSSYSNMNFLGSMLWPHGKINQIAVGSFQAFILSDGKVFYFTDKKCAELNIIELPEKITQMAVGTYHVLLLTEKKEVYACGNNEEKILGFDGTTPIDKPLKIPNIHDAVEIAAGDSHSLILTSQRQILVFGTNGSYQLGLGKNVQPRNSPTPRILYIEKIDLLITDIQKIIDRFATSYKASLKSSNNKLTISDVNNIRQIYPSSRYPEKLAELIEEALDRAIKNPQQAETKMLHFQDIFKACDYLFICDLLNNLKDDHNIERFISILNTFTTDKNFGRSNSPLSGSVKSFLFTPQGNNNFRTLASEMKKEIETSIATFKQNVSLDHATPRKP